MITWVSDPDEIEFSEGDLGITFRANGDVCIFGKSKDEVSYEDLYKADGSNPLALIMLISAMLSEDPRADAVRHVLADAVIQAVVEKDIPEGPLN